MNRNNDTQKTGCLTEQKCFIKCIELGFVVSKPLFDNARYDFILDIGTRLLRIQVKTSYWAEEEKDSFIFNGFSQHSTGNGNKRMKYTNKEIDYFMTEKNGVFYLFPADDKGFNQKRLRLRACQVNQPSIIWAEDYEFEKIVKGIKANSILFDSRIGREHVQAGTTGRYAIIKRNKKSC